MGHSLQKQAQAQFVYGELTNVPTVRLELHPSKTRIVYCKDINRRQDHPAIEFTFLDIRSGRVGPWTNTAGSM